MYVGEDERLGEPRKGRQPDVVRILLIDPAGVLSKGKLREEIRSKLEGKFNRLDPGWLKQANIRFSVQFRSSEPSKEEKSRFGPLDFPVYFLATQHGEKTVLDLMTEHKIPNAIKKQDSYDLVKECWVRRDTRGCGIPSGDGFRKIGFIKTHRVFQDATGDLALAFVNVTSHEIGHMGNRQQHSKNGLMKYPVPLNVDIDFDKDDKYLFLGDLQRLRALNQRRTQTKVQSFQWVFR